MELLSNLEKSLGFIVQPTTIPNLISITTPHTFISGDPVHFYMKNDHKRVVFDDYGMNVHSLALSLPMPDKAKRIIKQKLNEFDNQIIFDGYSISRTAEQHEQSQAVSELMSLFGLLTNFQPKSAKEQDKNIILHDIMMYLKRKYDHIEANFHTKGISGNQYEFDFIADNNTLVDFIPAHFNSTGAILRKIADVSQVNDDYKYRIIIDDSDKLAAQKESKIIATLAPVVPLSIVQRGKAA